MAPTLQHELDHTDRTYHTYHTDHNSAASAVKYLDELDHTDQISVYLRWEGLPTVDHQVGINDVSRVKIFYVAPPTTLPGV